MCFLSFWMICCGCSGKPEVAAGQERSQRPHSAQEKPPSSCFQVNSSHFAAPAADSSVAPASVRSPAGPRGC